MAQRHPILASSYGLVWGLLVLVSCSDSASDTRDTGGTNADTADGTVLDVILPDTSSEVIGFDTADTTDTSPTDTHDIDDIVPGGFLAPCQTNTDCLDGYCVEGAEGFFCTRNCTEECPLGYDCRSVQTGSADPAFLCLPRLKKVCVPCRADYQCTGGACLDIEGSGQCGYSCTTESECPTGYGCLPDAAGTHAGNYCQPKSGSCACTPETEGALRTCTSENSNGLCYGVETCDASLGWGGCTALVPSTEVCDGRDNDCNALVDDGVETNTACEVTVAEVGTCAGVRVCVGTQGYVCTAATPELEVCDFRDNDCDGRIDEGFADESGVYNADGHCGTCNNDCTTRIPNGVGRCEEVDGASPVCVVESCDPDYVAINRFQCSLPPDVSCQPCVADGDCFGGSCVRLDGQDVCVTPCGDESGACQSGYSCQVAGGEQRCLPVTRSCVCNALSDGQTRTCSSDNGFGTCYGQEVCNAATGWTGCSARTPAAEMCDGIDNDCNGRADDGVAPPNQVCASTVEGVGTCGGTWFCQDPDGVGPLSVGWTCSAPTPRAEVCDFLDDDCDGAVDDDFKNAAGLYVSDDHCGSCGLACEGAIPNATASCQVSDGRARCQVVSCAPGFYQAGPTTCVAARAEVCTPCATDANCPTPGDKCLDLDGGKFCGRDCAAGNLYGTAAGVCDAGQVCETFGAARQCVPQSRSCTCLAGDAGTTRTCLSSNDVGTCFGQQACNASGWSVCTARTASNETCNGVDDDCNSAVDDVAGRGQACSVSNGFGACPGVRDCSGSALVCVGQTPTAEVCDGLDNDCDGTTDEGYAGLGTVCTVGQGICQNAGVRVCAAGGASVTCSVTALPAAPAELCNALDDDCDGSTDEAFPAKNQVCETGLGVCRGFGTQVCRTDGSGLMCSAVAGASSGESCDLLDNDCDGSVDEDFITNGKYTSDTACGNCFTNCTAIFMRPNAFGQCNSVPSSPVCRMVCQPGFYDLNGVPDDGCEFQLDTTAVYVSESDAAATDGAGCGGGPTATGGGRFPCKKIGRGLDVAAAAGSGKTKVLVAGGAYYENVTLRNGIRLMGGYNPVNWVRNVRSNLTAIFGVQVSGHRKTVIADGLTAANTGIDGFSVYGQVANGVAENSYTIWVRNSGSGLSITNNTIWPGAGGPGQAGTRGSDGNNGGSGAAGRQAVETLPGASCFAQCSGNNAGGAAGTNPSCGAGTVGGAGANAPCPDWNEGINLCDSNNATVSQSSNPGGALGGGASGGTAGVGGCDQLIDPEITGCACNVPGVTAACPNGEYSSGGGDGGLGTLGAAGSRNGSSVGEVAAGEWRGFGGNGGGGGGAGSGGGGGGAGGGVESWFSGTTCAGARYSDFGGSGGGGGAGGCGGTGGGAGGPGGGAFGIFVVFTVAPNPASNVPALSGNDIHMGFGGTGGRGGDGGTAGRGGAGGLGGPGAPSGTAWCAQPGSKGGEGGDGGPGGGGGGGAGGVAYGLYASGGSLAAWDTGNTFFSDGAGGTGGAGGGTGAGGNAGQSGLTGTAAARKF